jgi:hypothetical protein
MGPSTLRHPELAAVTVQGTTRQAFLARGFLAVAAAYGTAAAAPFVGRAVAQGAGTGDPAIVQFALTLELLEATYYRRAVKSGKLSGEALAVAKEIRDHEVEHVSILTDLARTLGGSPKTRIKADFGNALKSEASFLALAQTFEDTGVGAYNGAAPHLQSPDVLEAAGEIVQTEARHAGIIRFLRGQDIAPAAFDEALSMEEVRKAVAPYIGR